MISYRKSSKDIIDNNINSKEFLAWKRLELSKAKLENISEKYSSPILLISFVTTTCLLVSSAVIAILIATCILPHLEAASRPFSSSPHDSFICWIEIAWILSNTMSLLFFIADLILLTWIKYAVYSLYVPISATVILIPVLLCICVFGIIFYRSITLHQYKIVKARYYKLLKMQKHLNKLNKLRNNETEFRTTVSYTRLVHENETSNSSSSSSVNKRSNFKRGHSSPHLEIGKV